MENRLLRALRWPCRRRKPKMDQHSIAESLTNEGVSLAQSKHLDQAIERFQAALEPMVGWLLEALKWSGEGRLNQALAWARTLNSEKMAMTKTTLASHFWRVRGATSAEWSEPI